jgi:dihydrofolate reductase
MIVSIVAAMGLNHTIGDDRGLPWKLPADLRRFKSLTLGKPVIMGRKTLESIGRPLPGRENIILTRNPRYEERGFHVAHSPQAAWTIARALLARGGTNPDGEVMIVGGGEIYRLFMRLADRVYLTVVEGRFEGTATFPFDALCETRWALSSESRAGVDLLNQYAHRFFVLERAGPAAAPVETARLLAG